MTPPDAPEPIDENVAAIADLMQADEDDEAVYGWMAEENEGVDDG